MNVEYSKSFTKAVSKLSGKYLESIRDMITEVKHATSIETISNCKKLKGFKNIYRIRVRDYRAFFLLEVVEDTVFFQYFVSRGEAYSKEYEEKLRHKDK